MRDLVGRRAKTRWTHPTASSSTAPHRCRPTLRQAISSATMLTAISGTVCEPML